MTVFCVPRAGIWTRLVRVVASVYVIGLASFLIALPLTWLVRHIAISGGIIDHPNLRSSHLTPTPRGGGLAIVIATSLGISALAWMRVVDTRFALALCGGGLAVACIGFMDDRGSVSVRLRFVIHLGAAVWAMSLLGGLPPLQVGTSSVDLGIGGDIFATIAIIWILNLFNFMDGIDGIAASEAMFVTGAGAGLGVICEISPATSASSLIVCGASLGFLVWNWPPAKIFMGDVGSGYLGYVIAVLALAAARQNGAVIFVWLILGGGFFVDATVTLVRRLLRRERIYEAHRSHAYQWLSRKWQSHKRVTLLLWGINVGWLLPLAWLSTKFPTHALQLVGVALTPLICLAICAGAGRKEA
jgi:Fuc2NAc and GlcNAc transferase